jgi:hypothetical protein
MALPRFALMHGFWYCLSPLRSTAFVCSTKSLGAHPWRPTTRTCICKASGHHPPSRAQAADLYSHYFISEFKILKIALSNNSFNRPLPSPGVRSCQPSPQGTPADRGLPLCGQAPQVWLALGTVYAELGFQHHHHRHRHHHHHHRRRRRHHRHRRVTIIVITVSPLSLNGAFAFHSHATAPDGAGTTPDGTPTTVANTTLDPVVPTSPHAPNPRLGRSRFD